MRYSQLNPLEVKLSMGLVRGKNDRVDSARLARYGVQNLAELRFDMLKASTVRELQALASERRGYVSERAAMRATVTDGNKGRSALQRDPELRPTTTANAPMASPTASSSTP